MTPSTRKRVKIAFSIALLFGASIQFVRPARTNPPATPGASIQAQVEVPPEVAKLLDRSCRDCHSNETQWPWYTNVAPVSWWVIDHVDHGRSHFKYSECQNYLPDERDNLLKQMCELTRKQEMPLPSYLRMHDAKLNEQDVRALCAFTDGARKALSARRRD
jgi:hypothetical protein